MKNMYLKRLLALSLIGALVTPVGVFAEEGIDLTTFAEENSENPVSVSMYPMNANVTSGTVSGYLGDYFKTKGLAVEVWAYSDEKTNAILASGDLPDIMHVNAENLATMIDAGMVLQLDEYLDDMPHVQEALEKNGLQTAIDYVKAYRSNETGNLYAMPTNVGAASIVDNADRNVVKLNWEIYEEAGAPEIASFDDLITVAKQMMEVHPTDENGNKIWGTILNSGSDATYWGNIITWMRWHGYEEDQLPYLLETDMINGTFTSILEENSMYYQGLKFYFDCMQAGVLDPDSINTERSAAGSKARMFGGGTQPGWRQTYYEYWMPGTQYYLNPETLYGDAIFGSTDEYIVVNAETENLEACLAFLDMMADPDAQVWGNAGPEGDMWQLDGNTVTLTEKGVDYYTNKAGLGESYFYENGEQAYLWNTAWILAQGADTNYVDAEGNPVKVVHTSWQEEVDILANNEAYNSWKETTGYDSWTDIVEQNDCLVSSSDLDFITSFLSTPDDSMKLTMSTINDTVVDASWKMVYAESEEEFNSIWEQMVADCNDLGAEDLMQWRPEDIENATAERDSVLGTAE